MGSAMPQRMGMKTANRDGTKALSLGQRAQRRHHHMAEMQPGISQAMPQKAGMPLCLFLHFHWSKRQKLMSGHHSARLEASLDPGGRGKKRPQRHPRGPVSPTSEQGTAELSADICAGVPGEIGVYHAPQHLGPRRPCSPASPRLAWGGRGA